MGIPGTAVEVAPPAAVAAGALVRLLSGPAVFVGEVGVEVPPGGVRLLALIALSDGPLGRRQVAGRLWPDTDDVRAAGSLRTALWRLRASGIDVVDCDRSRLWLRPGTDVDVRRARRWAAGEVEPSADWRTYALELLPGHYDEWIVFERERLRLCVLAAVEHLSFRLAVAGRRAEALEAAMTAVGADPLRESAQAALVNAHLAEGNIAAAAHCLARYRDELRHELGVAPGPELTGALTRALGARSAEVTR